MKNKIKSSIKIDDFSINADSVKAYYFNDKSKSDQGIERSMDISSFDNYVLNLLGVDKNKMVYEFNYNSSDHSGEHKQIEFSIPLTMLDLYDRLDNDDVAIIFEKHRKAVFDERVIMRSKPGEIVDQIQNLIKGLK